MLDTNISPSSPRRGSSRTGIVWLSFVGSMSLIVGLLALAGTGRSGGFLVAANVGALGPEVSGDTLFELDAPLERERWTGIVVHHTGTPGGDPEYLHRVHLSRGYQGLGYHFVIGNGSGFGDGIIHAAYRWTEQLPGAHVVGEQGEAHNQRSIAICLVGNGDKRAFTEKQLANLVGLVRRLQEELGIPTDRVYLHRNLTNAVTSPGLYFPDAWFRQNLIGS